MENSVQRLRWGPENTKKRGESNKREKTAVMEEEMRTNKTEEEEAAKYNEENEGGEVK